MLACEPATPLQKRRLKFECSGVSESVGTVPGVKENRCEIIVREIKVLRERLHEVSHTDRTMGMLHPPLSLILRRRQPCLVREDAWRSPTQVDRARDHLPDTVRSMSREP